MLFRCTEQAEAFNFSEVYAEGYCDLDTVPCSAIHVSKSHTQSPIPGPDDAQEHERADQGEEERPAYKVPAQYKQYHWGGTSLLQNCCITPKTSALSRINIRKGWNRDRWFMIGHLSWAYR